MNGFNHRLHITEEGICHVEENIQNEAWRQKVKEKLKQNTRDMERYFLNEVFKI